MRAARTPAPGSSIMAQRVLGGVRKFGHEAGRARRHCSVHSLVTRDAASPAVVVNCRFLTRPVTGVERFAEELTTRLVELRDDILLVAPTGELRSSEIGGQPVHRVGRLRGHLWEQSELPRFAHRHGKALMLNLANTGPAFSREQIVAIHDINHRRQSRQLFMALPHPLPRSDTSARPQRRRSGDRLSVLEAGDRHLLRSSRWSLRHPQRGRRVGARAGRKPAGAVDDEFFLLVGSPSAHKNIEVAIAGFLGYRAAGGRRVWSWQGRRTLHSQPRHLVLRMASEHRPRGG